MNYNRTFQGQSALPKQRIIPHGELKCCYTGRVFSKAIVDAYNRYTADFNGHIENLRKLLKEQNK